MHASSTVEMLWAVLRCRSSNSGGKGISLFRPLLHRRSTVHSCFIRNAVGVYVLVFAPTFCRLTLHEQRKPNSAIRVKRLERGVSENRRGFPFFMLSPCHDPFARENGVWSRLAHEVLAPRRTEHMGNADPPSRCYQHKITAHLRQRVPACVTVEHETALLFVTRCLPRAENGTIRPNGRCHVCMHGSDLVYARPNHEFASCPS